MILTLARVGWLRLRRSPSEILIIFVVPIVFFSIFAIIFSGQSQNSITNSVDLAVVDEDQSEYSRQLVEALSEEAGLDARLTTGSAEDAKPLDRQAAHELVRNGTVPVALVLPPGLGEKFPGFSGDTPHVDLLADPSDPVAPQIVSGLLQKMMMTAMPVTMIQGGAAQFEGAIGGFTEGQQESLQGWLAELEEIFAAADDGDGEAGGGFSGFVDVRIENVLGDQDQENPIISFYAAAIAVMFLLFSAAGAGGSLLEEEESQTLERLLSTHLGMSDILIGKWIYLTTLGILQVVLMFLWGWLIFGLDLFSHLPGFAVMTLTTAAAASGFGLVLATLSRTRTQLSGVSTIVILSMSALGGSMFPRFLMTDTMQRVGLLTFNAWAIDGYTKVFWREASLLELWPQVLVLVALTLAFMVAARILARRWVTT